MNLSKNKILKMCRNAKIDRLQTIYIDLTNDLKIIVDNTQEQIDKNPQQYIWLKGKQSGYIDALTKIEDNIRDLEELIN